MVAAPESDLLFIEVRDGINFQVEFSALNVIANEFLWKDWRMKESWWIGLVDANKHTLLLQSFINKGNPDHKNLIACDILEQRVRWEVNEFSFFDWDEKVIRGYRTKEDVIPAQINIEKGILVDGWENMADKPLNRPVKPVQYLEGTSHFETVKKFVRQHIMKEISMGVEYLEWNNLIVMSVYVQENEGLANYLLVFTLEGEIELSEKLGEKLQGLGVDTFFILSGCLFFVKNRSELVAYNVYD
jgi:hypothetical protein